MSWLKFWKKGDSGDGRPAPVSDDTLHTIALRALHGKLCFLNKHSAWMGGSKSTLEHERARIASLREWSATLEDARYRRQVERWLKYAEDGANEYEKELRERSVTKELDEYRRRRKAEDDAVYAAMRAHDFPTPR